jgi:acyl carrier protein
VNDEDAAMAIVDEVRQIIAQTMKVPIEQLNPETRLDDIGAASLDVIEIVFELEEKFGISIPFNPDEGPSSGRGAQEPNEAGDLAFQTIGEVASAVKSLVDAKKQAS